MQKNIYLLEGKNLPALEKRIHAWRDEFIVANGEHNYSSIDAEKIDTIADVTQTVLALPFLSDSRLVVIQNFPFSTSVKTTERHKNMEEDFLGLCEKVPDFTTLIFVSPSPDKRKSSYKQLQKIVQVETFDVSEEGEIATILKECEDIVSRQEARYIYERTGGDPVRISVEIEKLKLYADGAKITLEDIDMLIPSSSEEQVFDLATSLAEKNTGKALQILRKLLNQGEDIIPLMGILIWQFEQILCVKELRARKKSEQEIMGITKMKPFTYKKTSRLVQYFSLQDIKDIFHRLHEIDRGLKNGLITYTREKQEEARLVLEEFVVSV